MNEGTRSRLAGAEGQQPEEYSKAGPLEVPAQR